MTKRMLAALPLICLLVFAMDGSGTVPTATASTTPSLTAPAMGAPTDPGWGACRWYCGSKSYATAAQCDANCSEECEVIC